MMFDNTNIIVKKVYSDKNSKDIHRIHSNDGHELYLLIQGDVSFSINGSIYKIMPNDVLIINNNELHKTIVNKEVPHERIYIYFDAEYISKFNRTGYDLLQMFENRRHGFGNRIHGNLTCEYNLRTYFEEIYEWYQSDEPQKQIMIVSILLQLLVKINTICLTNRETEDEIKKDVEYNQKIYEIIRYISSNLDKKITLDSLEKKFYIDKFYLCHLFKDITGYSVLEYINYKRILSAKEEIKKGKSISNIWIQYGYANYSSFYRTFKKYAGMAPLMFANGVNEKI